MDDDDLPSGALGCSIANAGDINGDGYDDLIAGGYGPRYTYGGAYIYLGGPDFGSGERQPDLILPGGYCHGEGGYKENFGWQVAGGGDFNADGFDDVMVSARSYGPNSGRIYIYFGGDPMDTVEDVTVEGETAGNELGLCPIDLLYNSNGAYAIFGSIFVSERGKAYVLFGGEDYDDAVDLEIWGRNDSSGLTWGGGASSAGDVDHDGRDDFILAAPVEHGPTWDGAVYFYRGGNFTDDVYDAWLEGRNGEEPGWTIEEAGDFTGDGRDEFLMGSYAADLPKVWLCTFTGTGIEEIDRGDTGLELKLSATVTRNEVRFTYDKPLNEEVTLTIYDVTGALVRRYAALKESGAVWDLRDNLGRRVPSGAYTVRLTTRDAAVTQKVIVVK
ncbi:T9SS type A sorting domain-containing protein [candidate division WOR-3 bacterium]|uniref:T9SS type A sorting domain-containing protein n=1 Tax=candidate division WOR-3 bacterium TaxID=2052148 RepID=A0A9D5K9Z0_UNCW3|nr:T9SS type A sorting domain-containing protein [candidate division WOR-3 bacterium]